MVKSIFLFALLAASSAFADDVILCRGNLTNPQKTPVSIEIPATFENAAGGLNSCHLADSKITLGKITKQLPSNYLGSCYFEQALGKISLLAVKSTNEGQENVLRIEVVPERLGGSTVIEGVIFRSLMEDALVYLVDGASCELVGYK